MNIGDLIRRGLAMHQRHNLQEAERLYRLAILQDASHPDALHLLGMIMLERGDAALATELIRRALKRAPRSSIIQSNLGNALRASGRASEALRCYQAAVQLDPRHGAAHHNLGQLLRSLGRLKEAVASLRTALELNPNDLLATQSLAEAMMQMQDFEGADTVLQAQLERTPKWASGYSLRGAVQALQDRIDAAIEWLDKAIALEPDDARHLAAKGAWLLKARRIEDAAVVLRSALRIDAELAPTWIDMGRALRAKGDLEEARTAFTRTIELDPGHVDARRNLALLGDRNAEKHLSALIEATGSKRLSIEDQVLAEFALGKLLDDAERFEEAFSHYAAANELVVSLRHIDRETSARLPSSRLGDLLGAATNPVKNSRLVDETPVFVVGLPRSGTSLVEQIIASHSEAFGAGELSFINQFADMPAKTTNIPDTAHKYISYLKALSPQSMRIVDKMPGNIYNIDFISQLIDRPRVVFCNRNPLDNILSCYFQHFSSGNDFTYDLVACASRWLEADEIARAWLASPRLNAIELRYEMLIEDFADQSQRLVAFLGLSWEETCLRFYETQRVVATASGWQVRQPLYGKSVDRWRCYAADLKKILGQGLIDTLLERYDENYSNTRADLATERSAPA